MTFLEPKSCEGIKGAWHLGGLIFAAGAALYNIGALLQRRQTHLAINAAVYASLTLYELQKCNHHLRERGCP